MLSIESVPDGTSPEELYGCPDDMPVSKEQGQDREDRWEALLGVAAWIFDVPELDKIADQLGLKPGEKPDRWRMVGPVLADMLNEIANTHGMKPDQILPIGSSATEEHELASRLAVGIATKCLNKRSRRRGAVYDFDS